jgi:hypothetical protein
MHLTALKSSKVSTAACFKGFNQGNKVTSGDNRLVGHGYVAEWSSCLLIYFLLLPSNYAGSLTNQHIVVFIPPRKDVIGKWNNLRRMSSDYPNM